MILSRSFAGSWSLSYRAESPFQTIVKQNAKVISGHTPAIPAVSTNFQQFTSGLLTKNQIMTRVGYQGLGNIFEHAVL